MAKLVRCYGCGEVFDVMIPDMEPHDYPCPASGSIEVIDLGSVQRKAIAKSEKIGNKLRGGL